MITQEARLQSNTLLLIRGSDAAPLRQGDARNDTILVLGRGRELKWDETPCNTTMPSTLCGRDESIPTSS